MCHKMCLFSRVGSTVRTCCVSAWPPHGGTCLCSLRRYGQLSGMVEPLAGVFGAFAVVLVEPILPYALAFAAGAMVYVVVDDIIPEAQIRSGRLPSSLACPWPGPDPKLQSCPPSFAIPLFTSTAPYPFPGSPPAPLQLCFLKLKRERRDGQVGRETDQAILGSGTRPPPPPPSDEQIIIFVYPHHSISQLLGGWNEGRGDIYVLIVQL